MTTTSLILIDGSSYFFRAFHALPPLTNSKGQPTGAIYGVTNMIKRLLKDYQPTHIAVVFDAKGKTFRDEWYPDYKAHRPPMPMDLSGQFQPLLDILEAMGLPLLIIEGVEADDVIGTLAKQACAKNIPVLISTSDKDMAQLVTANVTLINTMTNTILDEHGVEEKFGVKPQQMIDYLSLVGDTSDNIPGVTKCGPKTAAKWLASYETLDNLIHHSHEISGKIGEYLRDSFVHLPLTKRLVTIKTDVDLPLTFESLTPKPLNRETLMNLAKNYEFKQWIKELNDSSLPASAPSSSCSYELVTTAERFDYWLKALNASALFAFTIQTTGADPMIAQIVGLSFAIQDLGAVYIPLAHQDDTLQLAREQVLAELKPIFQNPALAKVIHHSKFATTVLKQHDIELAGVFSDIMLESYVLNSNLGRHDLESLALKHLAHQSIAYKSISSTSITPSSFASIAVEKAAPYAAEAAENTLKLHHVLYPLIKGTLRSVLHSIELPLLNVLAEIEQHGVLIDADKLLQHGQRLKTRIAILEQEAIKLAGKSFNLNSTKQLQEILYTEQRLPILAKTPKGQPSTAESVLQELAYDYRLPAIILEYRSLSKLVSTYIDALPKCINSSTGRVHTCYNQAVTATGRLSSSDPNLQNIPIRTEEGRLIRTAFVAPLKHVLLTADYSQIELRIMAHMSQDPNLLTAFTEGWDIHAATASEIFSVPLDEVTHEQRRRSKAVNFGLIYGMSSFGLAKQLGVDRADAQQYIDRYFTRYPGVLDYMERTRQQARQQGYVETLFGRRLNMPDINASNMMLRKAAERAAINAPLQGTAADLIKKAMLSISDWQHNQPMVHARMIMQVHDELVFEVHEDWVKPVSITIKQLMEQALELSVPLIVTLGVGQNWDEAH